MSPGLALCKQFKGKLRKDVPEAHINPDHPLALHTDLKVDKCKTRLSIDGNFIATLSRAVLRRMCSDEQGIEHLT